MSTPLANKVTLVTGASRGIGQAIAESQAANGANVVINYVRNKGFAEDLVHRIEQNGGQALAVQADVSSIADLEALFQATIDQFGRLDILVNSAGIMTTKPIEQITEQDFEREFAINVRSVHRRGNRSSFQYQRPRRSARHRNLHCDARTPWG
jgi:3-oxoacyl-[acyl-carrier protein] reductase